MELLNNDIFTAKESVDRLAKILWRDRVDLSIESQEFKEYFDSKYDKIQKVLGNLVETYGEDAGNGRMIVSPDSPQWKKYVQEAEKVLSETTEFKYKPFVDMAVLKRSANKGLSGEDLEVYKKLGIVVKKEEKKSPRKKKAEEK